MNGLCSRAGWVGKWARFGGHRAPLLLHAWDGTTAHRSPPSLLSLHVRSLPLQFLRSQGPLINPCPPCSPTPPLLPPFLSPLQFLLSQGPFTNPKEKDVWRVDHKDDAVR